MNGVPSGLATVAFLPWMRRGIGTEITRVDGQADMSPRAEVAVTVTINDNLSAIAPIALVGPGEVTGIDPAVVVRAYPAPGTFDAERNYFALAELAQADLPWRYTPARATGGDRLRPWLGLVVLRDDEIVRIDETGSGGRLATVTVTSADALPLLAQSWAWAHVQVSGEQHVDAATLRRVLATEPQRAVARLLCPRRLDARTRYTACLVPTFERGRLTGLGEPVPNDLDALVPAWVQGRGNVVLPIYYRWRFGTGIAGDFEFLVRQIRPRQIPGTLGARSMDVQAPGADLPPAADAPLSLEGALTAVRVHRPPLEGIRHEFVVELRTLINRPTRLESTQAVGQVIALPRYGRWYAWRELVGGRFGLEHAWYDELNTDPRWRVAAGLGTRVVQTEQRQLLAGAWNQVEGIRAAIERMRQAQFARAAGERIYMRHVVPNEASELLVLTAPLHSRVRASPTTIQAVLRASPIGDGPLEAQFRRILRPLGPLSRRQSRDGGQAPRVATILQRMNRGELRAAPPPYAPDAIVTPRHVEVPAPPWWARPNVRAALGERRYLQVVAIVLVALAVVLAALVATSLSVVIGIAIVGAVSAVLAWVGSAIAHRAEGVAADIERREALRDGRLTPQHIAALPLEAVPWQGANTATAHAFRTAASEMLAGTSEPPLQLAPLRRARVNELSALLVDALRPSKTVVDDLRGRLAINTDAAFQPGDDPIEPPIAAPVFERPMYEALRDLSPEWLAPGLDGIPPNTAALLETNPRFIESFMVGLNHEMARELRWAEYPTDMRGTYFRQFWDVAGYVPPPDAPTDPDTLRDIPPIHGWGWNDLGASGMRPTSAEPSQLVLLIRGDLLQRYPNTRIYAVRARRGDAGLRVLDEEERHPLFGGRIGVDMSFFGFALTVEEARGVTDADSPNQGWFFMFQEQPAEMRFGLDESAPGGEAPPGVWSDLAWGHLAADDAALAALTYIDLDAQLPDTSGITEPPGVVWHADQGLGPSGTRASDLAYITLQQPMRRAIHASDMLLPP